jgi:Ni/Co efflux regulator RcnB
MKRNAIVCALVAMSLTVAGTAFAQGEADQQARDQAQSERNQRQQQFRRGYQQRGHEQQAQRGPWGHDQQARRGDRGQYARGAGPDHRFYPGDRLPPEYRNRSYVVDDWRGHHLSPPPRGYHWVQTGGDYVLVAIATGVILQLLLNN